ncbi:hypothetical protein WMY93_000154 [Mugilogobius chulae]|uniref:ribonuclease H n=1 Tax=Mugilogobius chulae TaxID=88201 RepID=A0AAW0Q048_9GOBI
MYRSCAMATSRSFHDEQPHLSPRPSRVRRIPGHLEDFELSLPSAIRPVSPLQSQSVVPPSPGRWSTHSADSQRAVDAEDKMQYLEERWQAMSRQMRELQEEMSNVRLTSQTQSAFARPSYPYRYTADQPQYSSLPQLERVSPLQCPSPTDISAPLYPPGPVTPLQLHSYGLHGSSFSTKDSSIPPAVLTAPRPAEVTVQPTEPEEFWPPPPPPVDSATAALLPPLYDITPAAPQHGAAPTALSYTAPRYMQSYAVPAYPQSVPQRVYPPFYSSYAAQPQTVPVSQPYIAQPPVSASVPNITEMAIASSFGIPKPKLTVFSSGKESDFLMLKKGLDSVLAPHSHLTEDYKYQVLLDHLNFPAATQIAKRYINSATPYTSAMLALQQRYGQPRQLVQGELKAILNSPPIRAGDYQGIEDFAAAVGTLVGMLSSMQGSSSSELHCGSHVDTLLTKLPPHFRDSFAEHCFNRGIIQSGSDRTYTLPDLAECREERSLVFENHQTGNSADQGSYSVISSLTSPKNGLKYTIQRAFTAAELNLANQSCSAEHLQSNYRHLKDIPLPSFNKVQPMILIGSDNPHLITPKQPVKIGPPGGPVAVCTALGWAVQGPANFFQHSSNDSSCLHLSFLSPAEELHQHVEKLWQVDTLPFRSTKEATRSGEDKAALEQLEQQSVRVTIDGVNRYAVPLLRKKSACQLHASPNAVMPLLRGTERRLSHSPEQLSIYNEEIKKLVKSGYAVKISAEELNSSEESWFLPHHLVFHNGKPRVVFNCSFEHKQACLNTNLLPGPNLGSSLLAVLLRFREHAVAISGDIRGMFHQVRLLPQDQSLLRFLWRDGEKERSPDVYEWRVLPFGTTCSPCCAIYALQRHAQDFREGNEDVVNSVLQAFYVDNCLQSLPSTEQAKQLIDRLRAVLGTGGFDIRQWSCNVPDVISHLPAEAKSVSCELWLSAHKEEPVESTLGLMWNCSTDTLSYRHRDIPPAQPTLRYVYRVLASQYDPLGFLIPYTTRAKMLVQALWKKGRDWDEPITDELLPVWQAWESELSQLHQVIIPRRYTSEIPASNNVELHIFTDASESAYGAVAYLRTEDVTGAVQVSFVLARSRVAPKKQLSIPRLELCAALSGAQLAKLLQTELTLPIKATTLWTDSTTVLHWIQSESQQYKVFVGTRVAEIQELVGAHHWRYIPSSQNAADDITRGKSLSDLTKPSRWTCGPDFLYQPESEWPTKPVVTSTPEEPEEVRDLTFCGSIVTATPTAQSKSWSDLIQATYLSQHGAAAPPMTASDRLETEVAILKQAQEESFPAEVAALQAEGLQDTIHPIVLAPDHPTTRLLIQHCDNQLLHPGPDRVFAEMRRTYWILRGRQAVKKYQRSCTECQRWRNKPTVPRMADLPAARLRLQKPPYWSTGIDCFGPYAVKIGRRQEKRWGIIFKCLTTRCVHLDLLCSMDTDSFLLALRRFVARRGKPYEILCDRATNFRGGDRELQRAFAELEPTLKEQLAEQSISFKYNPPYAPHFGEVEGILNSKPLGYASSDIADPDPITPNLLLMGRRDASLPQAVYRSSDLIGRRRWKHSQVLADHFWAQFTRNYLPNLHQRRKWQTHTPDLSTGQVVMVIDPLLPRARWPIGRVVNVIPSDDGRIRAAEVDIKGTIYTRPVAKLISLPEMPED